MPINFDPNSLNNTFDKNFGAGAYNAGLSNASNAARLKQQASLAKTDYLKRLTAAKTAALKQPKKTFQDALDYWDSNKSGLIKDGAYKTTNDLLNDPQKQQLFKDAGYNINDLVDAAYNSASNGTYTSKRAYDQYASQLNKDTAPNRKQNQSEIQQVRDLDKAKAEAQKAQQQAAKSTANNMSFYDKLNAGAQRIGDQFLRTISPSFANWNDQQDKELAQYELKKNPTDLSAIKALNRANASTAPATTAGQKALNYIGGTVGTVAPFLVGDGLLGAAGKAMPALNATKLVSNPLGKLAIQGAGSGLVGSGLQMGADSALSGQKYTPGQIASNLALNAGAGAIGAPVLHSLGNKIMDLLGKGAKPQAPTQETLGLSGPHNGQLALPEPAPKQLPKPDSPFMQLAKNNMNKARPMPDLSTARPVVEPHTNVYGVEVPKSIDEQTPQYWQKRYSDFVNFVHQNGYNENNLSHDAIQELWTHFAKPNEPPLNAVVDLAYKGYQEPKVLNAADVWDKLGNKQAVSKKAKNILGLNVPIKPVKEQPPLLTLGAKAPKSPKFEAGSTNIEPAPSNVGKNQQEKALNIDSKANADITAPNPLDEHGYGLHDTQALSGNTVKTLQKAKDILPTQTLTKNIYELAARLPKEIGNKIVSSLNKAKTNHVNNLEQRTNDLYNNVVKGLDIKKGSKESALVQDFGEKTLAKDYLKKRGIDASKLSEQELNNVNLQQLKKTRPNDWQKFVQADKYFKDNYKKMIDEVNATVRQIYPNQPDKLVPERQDYYHHFNQLDGFEGFKNLISNSAAIDPHLAGISPHTKPNSKWQAFKQMRGNGAYKSDAVGGYLKYLQAASHSTHIDPMIKVLRQSAGQIANATEGTKNLNYLKTALEVHADNLAGKTNPIDRLFQDHIIGRKAMQIVNVINSHIKKNMILGNLGSALGQIGNAPLAIGKAKQFAPQGLMDTLSYAANHLISGDKNLAAPIQQSQFLKERFSGNYFTRFDNGLLKKPEKMAAWLLETADKSGTYFTWNSMYRKGLAQGVANPIKYADAETRHIVAGRGVGEVPIAQKAKITQLVAPFSLEVGNQWKVLGKQMKEKDFAGVVTFLAASYGLNEVMNRAKGSDASYNPVKAVIDGYNKDESASGVDKLKSALANLSGETVGNIPGGAYIPQIMGLTNPNAKQAFFGNRSPDRFGTGLGVASTVFKPAADLIGEKGVQQFAKDSLPLIMPMGGNQTKKTWNGIEALAKGGSYDNKGNLQYPVDANNSSDLLHSLLVGPTTTTRGQNYYNNNGKALSSNQTLQFQNAPNKQDYYNNVLFQRKVKGLQKKLKDSTKDQSLSPQQKQQKLLTLMQQLQNLQK